MEYLQTTYGHDIKSARAAYKQYLENFASNLSALEETFNNHDIYHFRQHISRLNPTFSTVGLTDVSIKFQYLYSKCVVAKDLILYESEVREVLARIKYSRAEIECILKRLYK